MKKLLVLLLISICIVGIKSKEYLPLLGLDKAEAATSGSVTTKDMLVTSSKGGPKNPMLAAQFAELSRKDPDAYQKFLKSYDVVQERSEVDKLMNFLAHGKYE
jgi:hypothetical protein